MTSSSSEWGGTRYRPMAFSEQGVAMLSSVLRSNRAVQVNVAIMRAFVRLCEMLATHKELARKLTELEVRLSEHDEQIQAIRFEGHEYPWHFGRFERLERFERFHTL